jgi:hypothetical protein
MNEHEKGIEAALRIAEDDWNVGSKSQMAASITACISAYLEASGMVMVPREPTEEMELAGGFKCEGLMFEGDPDYTGVIFKDMGTVYKKMIAVAPSPFSQGQAKEGESA